jgi:anti-sigma B factor antagonist
MPGQPRQHLRVEYIGDMTLVHFNDKKILDKPNIQEIGEQLFRLVENLERKKLVLDFGKVEYLSSAALGKLITLQKKLKTVGGWLVLCNIEAKIHEVFKVSKLDKVFEIRQKDKADPEGGLARLITGLKSRPPADQGKSSTFPDE